MIKNISIICCGILLGGTLTIFVARYYYKTYIIKDTGSAINPESINNLNSLGSNPGTIEEGNSWLYSLTFRQAPLINKSDTKSVAIQAFNTAQTIFTEISETNNTVIYANLVVLREKTIQSDWKGIFDVVTKVKVAIDENQTRISEIEKELQILEIANIIEYSEYIRTSRALTSVMAAYSSALNNMLVGSVPSKEKVDAVNNEIERLKHAYWEQKNAAEAMLGSF